MAPATSNPIAVTTTARMALNRITDRLHQLAMPAAQSRELPTVVLTGVRRVEPRTVVRDWLRHASVGPGPRRLAAVADVHPADSGRDTLRTGGDRREHAAVRGAGLQVAELALQVRLQPAAVLALEGTQVVDAALELLAGLD